jgi:hypothetical protein
MFGVNISAFLDSIDNVAKETLEEPKQSATKIRSKRKQAESKETSRPAIDQEGGHSPTISNEVCFIFSNKFEESIVNILL